ncbi:MAG TPA: flagellar motor switch protein FliM [Sphingomonas sp.]|jgi:flagellar motor switch protein FliM|nr:flagellar motor switch protein FliM [Sphingomonas sp.]
MSDQPDDNVEYEDLPSLGGELEDFDLPDPPMASATLGGALDQAGIDALFGDVGGPVRARSGLKAVIESEIISYERLPMLEVVYDRMVRAFATSMRNLTSDAIDVSMDDISSIRFGDFINRLALPAMIGVFHIAEWRNYGLITVEPSLIYSVVDALLGGRRSGGRPMIDGRAFTGIEVGLVSRMLSLALSDFAASLQPIAEATLSLERIETSPRFASIAGPTNICAVATLRVDMDGRGGCLSMLFPYAAIEPIRHLLGQRFMGEKHGPENIWGTHMANEIRRTQVSMDVMLGETQMTLGEVRALAPGSTLKLGRRPEELLDLQVGGIGLGRAQIGQRAGNVAVRLASDIAARQHLR